MNTLSESHAERVRPLQSPGGRYAMLALDQRESLRAMFGRDAAGAWANDDELRAFKATGIEELTAHATAVLLDRPYSFPDGRPATLDPRCGLIVAADVLHQVTGEPVSTTSFDEQVTPAFLEEVGADAIKFLVMWNAAGGVSERADLVARAIELARSAGVASLIEAVVQTDDGEPWRAEEQRHEAILSAASEMAAFEPDVYKAQVPGYTVGDVSAVAEQSRQLTEIVGTDWVVLSNGIHKDDFADAVMQSLDGGASGFLAGRAIWADVVGSVDTPGALRSVSVPRLQNLMGIVESGRV